MRASLYGALGAAAPDVRVAVLVDNTGAIAVPANAVYVSAFAVDGGDAGDDGHSGLGLGGNGGNGGQCIDYMNRPVGGNTAVYVAIGAAALPGDPGAPTTVRWNGSGGALWTFDGATDAVFSGGTGGQASALGGGGGGAGSMPNGIGQRGQGAAVGPGTGGQASSSASYGSAVEMMARSGVGGDGAGGGSDGQPGQPWGGGGGGGGPANGDGGVGGKGGCLLIFSSQPITV